MIAKVTSLSCKHGRILGEAEHLPSSGHSLIPLLFCVTAGEGSPWAAERGVSWWCSHPDTHKAESKSNISVHPSPSLFAWNEWKCLPTYSFNIAPVSPLAWVCEAQGLEILGLFALIEKAIESWRQTWLKLHSVYKRWNWTKALKVQLLHPHKATSGGREDISSI